MLPIPYVFLCNSVEKNNNVLLCSVSESGTNLKPYAWFGITGMSRQDAFGRFNALGGKKKCRKEFPKGHFVKMTNRISSFLNIKDIYE